MSQSSTPEVRTAEINPLLMISSDRQPKAWYAVYTGSRHEKRVQEHFRSRQMESFLPLYRMVNRWKNGCLANVEFPLFPNYLFVQMARHERVRVLEVPGVIAIVGKGREPAPLQECEINALRLNLQTQRFEPHSYLAVGEKVRVRSGPLAGLQGVLVRKSNGLRFVLSLDLIQQSVAVDIAAQDLEPIAPNYLPH